MRPCHEGQEFGHVDVDVRETEDYFEILADVPGRCEDMVVVLVDDGRLIIEAQDLQHGGEASQFLRQERRIGGFRRVFRLTARSNSDAIYSGVEHGVLRVVIPKALPQQEVPEAFQGFSRHPLGEMIPEEAEPRAEAEGTAEVPAATPGTEQEAAADEPGVTL